MDIYAEYASTYANRPKGFLLSSIRSIVKDLIRRLNEEYEDEDQAAVLLGSFLYAFIASDGRADDEEVALMNEYLAGDIEVSPSFLQKAIRNRHSTQLIDRLAEEAKRFQMQTTDALLHLGLAVCALNGRLDEGEIALLKNCQRPAIKA